MEGRFNLVSKEEEIEFRKKYKLSVIEAEAVLYQKEYTLTAFEKGRRLKLYNEEFVRMLIDDEDKFKAHIERLYKEGKIIKRIYAKVFTDDVLKSKEAGDDDKYKYFNQDIAKKVLEFQKMFNITDGKLMHIFDITKNEVELLKKGIFIDDSKAQIMSEAINSKEGITELLRKRIKEGKLSANATYNLIDEIAVYYREDKDKEKNKIGRRYNKREKGEELERLVISEEVKEAIKNKELDKLREDAKKEFASDSRGLLVKTKRRDSFIEALYKRYSNNEKIDSEDINLIKGIMMVNKHMVSSYTLKIVIIGSLRTEGYEVAYKNINEFIANAEDQEYKVKLIKFRKKLDDEYNKMRIEEMRIKGYDKYQIIKELNLTTKDFWRLVDEGR